MEKESEVGDSVAGSAEDAQEHWRSVAESIYNLSNWSKALSAADFLAPTFVRKEEAASPKKETALPQ